MILYEEGDKWVAEGFVGLLSSKGSQSQEIKAFGLSPKETIDGYNEKVSAYIEMRLGYNMAEGRIGK